MKLSERFTAVMVALTAAEFTLVEGKPELTEANVEALEAAAERLESVEAENTQLKGDNQAHAERITELEASVESNAATVSTILDALESNNMPLAEGAELGAFVAEKINAYGKTVPAATPVVTTGADDLGDANTDEHLSEIDKRARARFAKRTK